MLSSTKLHIFIQIWLFQQTLIRAYPKINVSIVAKAGDYTDTITIRKVQERSSAYYLASSSIQNWFDNPGMDSIPGFYSIQDKMEDIRQNSTGWMLIDELIAVARASRGSVTKEVKRTEAMERMLYRNTVLGLVRQAGGTITREMALELNQKLRQIPKQANR